MGKVHERIDTKLADWIGRQRLFFVATAPGEGGRVNLSPKGPIDSLRILDERTVEYDDHVGSGAETIAHLRDNGRICMMFCAFDGPPRIDRISDSCGYGVPLMEYVGERPQRAAWLASKGADGVRAYVSEKNATSIDGL